MNRAIFLDRDGTLIEDQKYDFDPNGIHLLQGVTEGLRELQEAGYKLVVVTNQSGVARGLFDEERVREMHKRLADILAESGLTIDAFFYCPHHIEGCVPGYSVECDCRKPKPGMIFEAARSLELELAESWMIGDICDDVEAGRRAGCRTVLIGGHDGADPTDNGCHPTLVARDLRQAARLILSHGQGDTDGRSP